MTLSVRGQPEVSLAARRVSELIGRFSANHLQDLGVGLVGVGHLHPVDLDEDERRDLVLLGGVLQAAHHFLHRGRLPRPRHAGHVHAPEEEQQVSLRAESSPCRQTDELQQL